jgi:hypothetical protein
MSGRRSDPIAETEQTQEWPIPQVGISPVTGVEGALTWGSLNKFDQDSRWVIGDADLDDMINVFPQLGQLKMTPNKSAIVATLPSPMIWQSAQILNGNLFTYYLCQNGHIYQVATNGAITDVYAGGTFTQSGTLGGVGSQSITGLTSTANMFVGMGVSGANIPANSKITIINSATAITINNTETGGGTETITFTLPLLATSQPCDISDWQGTQILISDSVAQVLYAWNGSTLTAALSGQPATFIAVYSNRVWLLNGISITWTQGGTYNSLAGDAGSAKITDASLTNPIICAYAIQSALYLFGSNWTASISNLLDQGAPAVLTFQFTILSAQIGIISKWGVIAFGNTIYFANAYGIWQLQGSAPVKVSSGLDGFFQNLNLANSTFAGAYGEIASLSCIFWVAYYNGDSNVAAGYTVFGLTVNNQLFRLVQGNINFITGLVSSAITNNIPQVWATDGTNIFLLFQDFATPITANINTKIWDMGSKIQFKTYDYAALFMVIASAVTVTLQPIASTGLAVSAPQTKQFNPNVGQWINAFGVQGQWQNAALTLGNWQGVTIASFNVFQFNLSGTGPQRAIGLNITLLGAGVVLQALVIGWKRTKSGRHIALTDI